MAYYIYDTPLIKLITKTAKTLPLAAIDSLVRKQHDRSVYFLKVFNSDIATMTAVRNAAAADSRDSQQKLAAMLTVLLSSGIPHVTSLDVPTTLPSGSLGQPVGTVIVADTTGFPTAGTF